MLRAETIIGRSGTNYLMVFFEDSARQETALWSTTIQVGGC